MKDGKVSEYTVHPERFGLPVHDPRMVAHQWASLDYLSNGRALMGVGIGRP